MRVMGDRIEVLRDWVLEEEPATAGPYLVQAARMAALGDLNIVLSPIHFDLWRNIGLKQAV